MYFANTPRNNYDSYPDWGITRDYMVPTNKNKKIEIWVTYPDGVKDKITDNLYTDNPTVILTHAWGRNRDRMVCRAKKWAAMGFTTIVFSARDHGNSSKEFFNS